MTDTEEVKCNRCGSGNFIYAGWGWRNGVKNVRKHRCKDCGKIFVLPNNNLRRNSYEVLGG